MGQIGLIYWIMNISTISPWKAILFTTLSSQEHQELRLGLTTLYVTRLGLAKKVHKVGPDWGLNAHESGQCSGKPQTMYKVGLNLEYVSICSLYIRVNIDHYSWFCWLLCMKGGLHFEDARKRKLLNGAILLGGGKKAKGILPRVHVKRVKLMNVNVALFPTKTKKYSS